MHTQEEMRGHQSNKDLTDPRDIVLRPIIASLSYRGKRLLRKSCSIIEDILQTLGAIVSKYKSSSDFKSTLQNSLAGIR